MDGPAGPEPPAGFSLLRKLKLRPRSRPTIYRYLDD